MSTQNRIEHTSFQNRIGANRIRFVDTSDISNLDNYSKADCIYCIDLKDTQLPIATDWVKKVMSFYHEETPELVPCMLVIGLPGELEGGAELEHLGAVLYEKSQEFDELPGWQKRIRLEEELSLKSGTDFEEFDGQGETSDDPSGEGDEESGNGAGKHIPVYANPPFQISNNDFDRLLERMEMADDDYREND